MVHDKINSYKVSASGKKDFALDILEFEHKYYLLSDDLLDLKMELDKFKSNILDGNIYMHIRSNNSSDSDDAEHRTSSSLDKSTKHCTKVKSKKKNDILDIYRVSYSAESKAKSDST